MKTNKTAFRTPEGKAALQQYTDGLLAYWMAPHEIRYAHTRFGHAHVIVSGPTDAPAVVLLHGSAMSSVMWTGDAPVFARTHRVFAVDLPGEPGKSDDRQLPFKGLAFAEWLDDVFRALNLQSASLVGISLGAWVALKFAAEYPDRVDKLVLLSPAGIGPQKVSFLITSTLLNLLGEGMKRRLLPKVNGTQELPEVVLHYQRLIDDHFNYRKELLPLFTNRELKRLSMPVLAIAGGKDAMFHMDRAAQRLKKLVPHAAVRVLPEAGHVLIGMAEEISRFLNGSKS